MFSLLFQFFRKSLADTANKAERYRRPANPGKIIIKEHPCKINYGNNVQKNTDTI